MEVFNLQTVTTKTWCFDMAWYPLWDRDCNQQITMLKAINTKLSNSKWELQILMLAMKIWIRQVAFARCCQTITQFDYATSVFLCLRLSWGATQCYNYHRHTLLGESRITTAPEPAATSAAPPSPPPPCPCHHHDCHLGRLSPGTNFFISTAILWSS